MTPEQLCKRFERAERKKRPWLTPWQDCVDFAQPMRDSFLNEDSPGQERMDRIYDETPVLACQEFVSIMKDGMMPDDTKFFDFDFVIPYDDPQAQGQLREVSDYVYSTMQNAYFDGAASEVFYDVAIGTGSIGTFPCMDTALASVKYENLNLQEYVMDLGPFGMPDGRFRKFKKTKQDIMTRWPSAKLPQEMTDKAGSDESHEFEILECAYRDWKEEDEVWLHKLIDLQSKKCFYEQEDRGFGCEPIASGRWSKAGKEVWGRGPLFNALPAIRSLNLTYELLFEASEMNIGGVWQYESNGIINPDNIQIVPGTLIPTEPGTRGLSAIQNPGRFDLSQIILRDQQEKVKRALYNQDFGPLAQSPKSATEIAERSANLNRLIGASRHRLERELIIKTINRTVYVLKQQGKIELPKLDGKELRIKPVSPMARFSKRSDIQAMQEFHGQLQMMYGPQVAMMITKVPETAHQLAQYNDYPMELLNGVDEIKGAMGALLGAATQQQESEEAASEGMPIQ